MTEAEIIEVVAILGSNTFSIFAVYLSITFAYLAASYFVGGTLNKFQVYAMSALYIASAGLSAIACVGTTEAWTELIATQPTMLNTLGIYSIRFWDGYMAILLAAGMFISLYFMYEIRKRKRQEDEIST